MNEIIKTEYDEQVDYEFLEAMGIKVVKYQPWQLGLTYPDLTGKFLWYPKKGTLMFEGEYAMVKIGETGDYCAGQSCPDADATEKVYNQIIKKVNEQQS